MNVRLYFRQAAWPDNFARPAMPHPQYPHIFTPLDLPGGIRLRNRIAISAHFAGWWVDKGLPSDAFVAYVEERAKDGGVGLFVIGATSPEPGSGWLENTSDAIIPRYAKLVEAGHRHGTAIFAQLCHPGYRPLPDPPIIEPPIAAVPTQPPYEPGPRYEPTVGDLHRLVGSFAAAAKRAIAGGVDGVELHSHESFLHAQMLNPIWNTRTDEYGGSLDNRMRFLIETLSAMREMTGDKPLGVRLKLDDMAQRGMTFNEYLTVVQRLESLGLVDYVSVTGGDGRFHHGPMPRPEGEWLPLVRQLRAGTKLIVMHAGRIATPELAEQALAEGWLDIACMTKSHICDPHFTRKLSQRRVADIRFCTRCLQSCHGKMDAMTCVYNPLTSRELTWAKLEPAAKRKRVVIVGAGPAGMECAITAAARGHEVIVLERDQRVGGQVWIGAGSPLRKNWSRIAEFYQRQAEKGEFEVRYGLDATAEVVTAFYPDAVVVATGSSPLRLPLRGDHPEAFTVHDVVAGRVDAGRHVLLYDREGFNRPLVAADYLSSRGIAVTFVTPLPVIGGLVEGMMLEEMTTRLRARNVRFLADHDLVSCVAGVALLRSVSTGEALRINHVDRIVATVGSSPVNELALTLEGRVPELHVIGDATLPQTVEAATYHGARLARLL